MVTVEVTVFKTKKIMSISVRIASLQAKIRTKYPLKSLHHMNNS
jgi:hypothetical protein